MMLKQIESFSRYQEIVGRYGQKGCVSNDYIQRAAADMIICDALFECCGRENAFLLVKKDGFWRVYYYLNDFNEVFSFNGDVLETEILFRGSHGEPVGVVAYLEKCGFKRHLVRDQYAGMYKDLQPSIDNDEMIVQPALTLRDMQAAFELFNQSFDKYSGDFVSSEDYEGLLARGAVLLAFRKQDVEKQFLGALHQTIDNNVAWVSHVAVKETARGHHVGRALLDAFVERNMVTEKSRYLLWVQHQNDAALRLYEKKGFKYVGKSSLSMIKL